MSEDSCRPHPGTPSPSQNASRSSAGPDTIIRRPLAPRPWAAIGDSFILGVRPCGCKSLAQRWVCGVGHNVLSDFLHCFLLVRDYVGWQDCIVPRKKGWDTTKLSHKTPITMRNALFRVWVPYEKQLLSHSCQNDIFRRSKTVLIHRHVACAEKKILWILKKADEPK